MSAFSRAQVRVCALRHATLSALYVFFFHFYGICHWFLLSFLWYLPLISFGQLTLFPWILIHEVWQMEWTIMALPNCLEIPDPFLSPMWCEVLVGVTKPSRDAHLSISRGHKMSKIKQCGPSSITNQYAQINGSVHCYSLCVCKTIWSDPCKAVSCHNKFTLHWPM